MGDAYKFSREPIRKRDFSVTHRSVSLTTDRCRRRRCCRIGDAMSDIIVSPNVLAISGQLCCSLVQSSNHRHWGNIDVLAARTFRPASHHWPCDLSFKETYLSCGDGTDATEAKADSPGREIL